VLAHKQPAKKGYTVNLVWYNIINPINDNIPEENSIRVSAANINGVKGLTKVLLKCSLLNASSLFQLKSLSREDCINRMLKKAPVKKRINI
jgi:hypothetical protein